MRSFVIAIIIVTVSSFSLGLSSFADSKLDEIVSLTENILSNGCESEASHMAIELIASKWEESEKLFHITVARGDIALAKKEIASALGASHANSNVDFLTACERLAAILDNVKGYTTCRPENIF